MFPPKVVVSGMRLGLPSSGSVYLSQVRMKVGFFPFRFKWIQVEGGRIVLYGGYKKGDNGKDKDSEFSRGLLAFLGLPFNQVEVEDVLVELRGKERRLIGWARIERLVVYRPDVRRGHLNFDGKVEIAGKEYAGTLESAGWIDWDGKNAHLKVKGDRIDLSLIAEVFGVSPGLRGFVSFKVDGQARENDLVLKNEVELHEFVYESIKPLTAIPIIPALVPLLDGLSQPNMRLEFTIRTKLDNPKLDLKRQILNAIRTAVKQGTITKNESDKGGIYGIINDLVGIVGSVVGDIEDILVK